MVIFTIKNCKGEFFRMFGTSHSNPFIKEFFSATFYESLEDARNSAKIYAEKANDTYFVDDVNEKIRENIKDMYIQEYVVNEGRDYSLRIKE